MFIHKNKWLFIVCIVFLSVAIQNIYAGPFEKGGSRVSVVVGSGYTLDESYIILGLGAGYFVLDGLELGLDGQVWMGGDPDIYKLKPQATYILPIQSRLRPYGGVFYSRIFIDGYDDLDTAGARGGCYSHQTADGSWGSARCMNPISIAMKMSIRHVMISIRKSPFLLLFKLEKHICRGPLWRAGFIKHVSFSNGENCF